MPIAKDFSNFGDGLSIGLGETLGVAERPRNLALRVLPDRFA
ncbi:MAG: hypothetical protein SGJ19_12210 [Planctomycetia bacterium]|nr:hypothetical protein [Planctomycetia bacterium]